MAKWHKRAGLARDFAFAAVRYWLSVHPEVRRETRHWQCRARSIANPRLRLVALENFHAERTNLEGAAAFATFAPRRLRPAVIRAQVTFQAAYDYADTLAEQSSAYPVINARQLHRSLIDAVRPCSGIGNYYGYHGDDDDGGYLGGLVRAVRTALTGLPAYREISRSLQLAAARIVEYQACIDSHDRLAVWVKAETSADSGMAWWETAAASGSSMLVFALMARAAAPIPTPSEIACIDQAYFPWIGALHTLLDSMVDRADDVAAGRLSLIDYYGSPSAAVERLSILTAEARRRATALPAEHGHVLILVAMMSSYLSSTQPATPHSGSAQVVATMGALARPTLAVFRLRRLATQVKAKVTAVHFTR
ncbi:MAG TPA: DUF2600 family protein [Propionibacteriaceae bacterium]|nr:DUF2600 family protein [Propionibacteriaceae bacterium]